MTADNDGLLPPRDWPWDSVEHDGFTEDSTAEDVANCTVWTLPHVFELEFFDTSFVGGDGGAFDTDIVFQNGLCGVDGNLIVGLQTYHGWDC